MTSTHQLHETRSLRMHRLVAELWRREPVQVVRFALENLDRWRQQGVDCDDFGVWENLLDGPPHDLIKALTGDSDEARRLRQSSPFAGLITEEARRRILASTR